MPRVGHDSHYLLFYTFSNASLDIINLTANFQSATPNALETVLEEHMAATKSLMSKFVDLDEAARFQQDHGDVYAECQKAKTECISLRLQIDDMQHKLQDSESQKERYHAALRVAENQVERLRSTTLNAIHQAATKKQKTKHDTPEESIKPPSPAEAQSSANGTYEPIEGDALQEILKLRDARIAEVEKELAALREKKLALELEVRSAMPEYLATNQYYKYLYDQTGTLQVTVEAQRERIAKLTEELRNSLATRKEWEESFVNSMSQSMNELKSMVMKRDAEIARIRDQRDIAQAEIVERKHLESLKVGSTDEVKKMVESRGERIAVLESELRRLRAQLAAHARDEDLMLFFCNGKEDLQEYIQDLKDRLKQAEARSSAMEDTLRLLDQNHPDIAKHMRAEAEARQMLEKVIEDLQRYKSAYGDLSTLPPEAAQLAQQLSQRDEELQRLRLLDRQREQSEMSLYTEIDKLSAAWEALDKQLKGKIFDLTAMEEKLAKGTLDRAKLENKYYAAMRDKEATESERKNLARNNEKQAKAIERMVDAERNLAAQLNSAEKEIAGLRQITDLSKQKIDDLEKTLKEAQMRLESEQTRMNELYALVRDRERALDVKKQDLRKMEESLIKSKKAIEKQAAKQGQANPEDSDDVYLNHLLVRALSFVR
ncbi:hypothetical protein AX16_010680 [Volvariella volvacea WC 439]|nr:hypothetical protein AX16_010680 [Volvariella volvacea WC 439]